MDLKNGWDLISSAPFNAPRRAVASRRKSLETQSLKSSLIGTSDGNATLPLVMLSKVPSRVDALNGVVPYAISYMKIPSSHQSTAPE